MTFGAVVIGCGRIGSLYDADRRGQDPLTHAGAYSGCPKVTLVAGVDPNAERRAAFAKRWEVPAYATVDELLGHASPELWSICTGADSHPDLVRRALGAGARAVWCEKPLARRADDARAVVDEALAAGVPLAVNYVRRWDAAHQAAAEWGRTGLGELQHGVVHYTRGVRNYGSHAFDLLRWFLGEPRAAWARPGYETDDPDPSPVALLWFGPAAVAFLPVRRAAFDVFEVDLVGTHGRLTIGDLGRSIRTSGLAADPDWGEPRVLSEASASLPAGMRGMMRAAVEDLVEAVASGTPVRCTGEDGVMALRIAEAVERSIATGREVILEGGRPR